MKNEWSAKSYNQGADVNGETILNTQEDRIKRLRAEVSDRGRDIANLLEQIEAKDAEIAALKVERDRLRMEGYTGRRGGIA